MRETRDVGDTEEAGDQGVLRIESSLKLRLSKNLLSLFRLRVQPSTLRCPDCAMIIPTMSP